MASRHCIAVSLVQLASRLLRVQCKLPERLLKVASSSQFRDYALLLDSELLPNRGRWRTLPRIRSLLWVEGNPPIRGTKTSLITSRGDEPSKSRSTAGAG